jgi:hypothetical protein
MANDATKVKMGVCQVTYGSTDLGYTAGGVTISYSVETEEVEVDQEAFPIKEIVTSQSFEVTVPMAEYNLSVLKDVFPDATFTAGDGTTTSDKLELSGGVVDMSSDTDSALTITPTDSSASNSETIILGNAQVSPQLEFSFTKEGARIFELTFKAMKPNTPTTKWVTFGTGAAD